MDAPISEMQCRELGENGYLRLRGAFNRDLPQLNDAVDTLSKVFPYGFADPRYYTGARPRPLTSQTARSDGRILIPHAGFHDFRILSPLKNPFLHELLERIVGKQFYLSNTWFQAVPPGAGRMAFHKDTRGSITFNILLSEIGPAMGSTCVVPGSHINTPPANYCFSNILSAHPREVDMTGAPGDLVLFSTEAWHARSKNQGAHVTRRLFYNFYSRSSRETTAWAGVVDPKVVESARDTLPPEFGHMFELDLGLTRKLINVGGTPLRRWAFAKSSSDDLVRDIVYAAYAYGRSPFSKSNPGFLMPYTTGLTSAGRFSLLEYISHLKVIAIVKELYHGVSRTLRDFILRRSSAGAMEPSASSGTLESQGDATGG
jgi:hypothetical protein